MSEYSPHIVWIKAAAIEDNPAFVIREQKRLRALADAKRIANRLKGLLPASWQKAEPVVDVSQEEEFIPPQRVRFGISVRVDTIDFESLEPFEIDPARFSKEGFEGHPQDTEYVKGIVRYHSDGRDHVKEFVFPAAQPYPA